MTRLMLFVVLSAIALGCAAPPGDPGDDGDVGATSDALLGCAPIPREAMALLRRRGSLTPDELDRVFRLEHDIRVGRGRTVRVTEHFSIRSWLRWRHRGALLLPGTVVTGSFYELDVDGYRFASDLAREGYFVFAMDYEGTGGSTYPADGASVTHAEIVDAAERVLRVVRLLRWIHRVDAIGESNGAAVAAELCSDRRRVRSCVLSSAIYREGTPFFQAAFLDPGFLAFLRSQPNGYLDVTPDLYFNITSRTPPDVTAEILATQPGVYAVAPLLEPTTLPWFDPTRADVPALILQGTEDNIATQADMDALAAEYGSAPGARGTATLVRIPGAGHIPRVEPAPSNHTWSSEVITFLAP